MLDRTRNPAMANKFERYLVQFVKLLCQQQPDEVEKWVSKSYFPVEKCLKVCTDAQNQLGVAILTKSNGAPHQAIDLYCNILTNFPSLGLLEQVKLLYKDQPSFLQDLVEDDGDNDVDTTAYKKRDNFNMNAL